MKKTEVINSILSEIGAALDLLVETDIDQFVEKVRLSKRVFLSGAGRSGILVRAFAVRLMQMGFTAYVVGETTTPAIGPDDLLILMSGSGETESSYLILSDAKKAGAYTYLITAHKNSRMWDVAQGKLAIPGPTRLSPFGKEQSEQFIGSLFEQASFVFFESVIQILRTKGNMDGEGILRRHANLE